MLSIAFLCSANFYFLNLTFLCTSSHYRLCDDLASCRSGFEEPSVAISALHHLPELKSYNTIKSTESLSFTGLLVDARYSISIVFQNSSAVHCRHRLGVLRMCRMRYFNAIFEKQKAICLDYKQNSCSTFR